MTNMHGKVIAVTGAASGIGLETANYLWYCGASLSLADQNAEALESAAAVLRSRAHTSQMFTTTVLDVTNREQVYAWITNTVGEHGRLDGAANLAGTATRPTPIELTSDEDWEYIMGVNCTGVFYCMRAQVAAMTALKTPGSIVNASSIAGLVGMPNMCNYVASKHAVAGLTKAVAKEVGDRKIRVNAVAPGTTQTPLVERMEKDLDHVVDLEAMTALKRRASPVEIAKSITYLLSDDSSYQTGTVMVVDGGWIC